MPRPELDVQVRGEPLAQDDASVVGRLEELALHNRFEERQGLLVLVLGGDGDEAGADVVPRRRQHVEPGDALHHPDDPRVALGEALQLAGPLDGARQGGAVEVLRVLVGHVTRAEPGRELDHVGPVPVLHRHHEDGEEDPEDDGREGDGRAAAVPPQVAPRHLRETAALHDAQPFLGVRAPETLARSAPNAAAPNTPVSRAVPDPAVLPAAPAGAAPARRCRIASTGIGSRPAAPAHWCRIASTGLIRAAFTAG